MPSANRNMAGGVAQVQAYGQKDSLNQLNTWAAGDQWTANIASTQGNATLGVGNLLGQNLTCLFIFRDRVYAGNSQQFNFSDNGDATGWEVQNSGAGSIAYVSSYGSQDTVQAFSQLQGRLAVFGRRSVQLWSTDADPSNFSWIQTLDNSGTMAPLSTQNIGDSDVLYADDSGFRSLKAKETTNNAFVDDVGSSIDDLFQAARLAGSDLTKICSVIEPTQKNVWFSVPGVGSNKATIYVLSKHPAVKQNAWSSYNASYVTGVVTPSAGSYDINGQVTYTLIVGHVYSWTKGAHDVSMNDGTNTLLASGTFTAASVNGVGFGTNSQTVTSTLVDLTPITFLPAKFFIHLGLVYVLATDASANLYLFQYGGSTGQFYDGIPCVAQLPWLDDKQPDLMKVSQGIQAVMSGDWKIEVGMDPVSGTLTQVEADIGTITAPNDLTDSTYDKGRFGVDMSGTHFTAKMTSKCLYGLSVPARFSSLSFAYNRGATVS